MDPASVTVIIQEPEFRLLTTLRYVQFNHVNVVESLPLIQEWKRAELDLLSLSRHRLHAAAQACFGPQSEVSKKFKADGAELALRDAIDETTAARHPEPAKGFFRDLRVRVLVGSGGQVGVECVPMGPEKPLTVLENDTFHHVPRATWFFANSDSEDYPFAKVYIDSVPTSTSIFTRHKTTFRQPYDEARSRAGIVHTPPTDAEVLLFNSRDEITEASVSTPYFFRRDGMGGYELVTPSLQSGGMIGVTQSKALREGFCTMDVVTLDGLQLRHGDVIWLSNAVRGFFRGRIHMQKEDP
ncbi:hypothetical protein ABEF95_016980 [Exophiala dermatitidis]